MAKFSSRVENTLVPYLQLKASLFQAGQLSLISYTIINGRD